MHRRSLIVIPLAGLLVRCGGKKKPAARIPVTPAARFEEGIASWYGHPYHGRRAANGEVYDMEEMTAAHKTLPFGTWVRVLNLENNRTVEVRITDRGPFIDDRIIDLSRAGARAIDMIGPGTARVRVEIVGPRAGQAAERYAVQIGAFRDRANAERLKKKMERDYGTAQTVMREGEPPMWRVLVGVEPTLDGARALAQRLRTSKETSSAFVVRLDS
ncbi:MAG: septal ring lytic transglycosylase RlpA family protein [Bryobacteraceae bacterium]